MFFLIGISFCSNLQVSQSKIIHSNISAEELDLGYSVADYNFTSPLEIRVDSDHTWDLYLQSKDLNLMSNNGEISIQKIQWKRSSDNDVAYRPLSYERTWIGSSHQYKDGIVELNFRMILDWSTSPGEYSVPVEFIIEDKPSLSKKRKIIKTKKIR